MAKKRCCRCKRSKDTKHFYNDRTQVDGKTRRCRECSKTVARNWRQTDSGRAREKWRNASRKYSRATGLYRKYGITDDVYKKMLAAQGGTCAICGVKAKESKGRNPGRLVIDHSHVSNTVRGLLCSPCNTMLGLASDDPTRLQKASDYLIAAGRLLAPT